MRLLLVICCAVWSLSVFGQEINHDHSIHHAFVENKGQWNDQVLFKSKLSGGNLWVEQGRFLFHFLDLNNMQENHRSDKIREGDTEIQQELLELIFWGANDVSEIEKEHATSNYYNYFLGNDEERWATEVRGYGEATLKDLYDGIDMKLIEDHMDLKYEFHVQPGADPSQIVMLYNGYQDIAIDRKGNLKVKTILGEIVEQKPYVYQIVNGNIREVASSFHLEDGEVTFELGEYNPHATLVIDPVLVFSTYSGSVTDNFGMTATYGYDGSAYSGGIVFGNSYPTPAPAWNTTTTITNVMPTANDPLGTYGVTDVFISKYSADGTQMLWTCFLGGGNDSEGTESVHSLICDTLDNVYLYGATSSNDFPMQNAYDNTYAGGTPNANFTQNGVHHYNNGTDIFVSKLSADGLNLLGSTYVGGTLNDGVNYNISNPILLDSLVTNYGDQFRGEIMLDENFNVIVASMTRSTDFPVLNAFQTTNGGGQDGVLFKLTTNLDNLLWSSYYGGSENDACYSAKVDTAGNVIFAGGTSSNNLPGMGSGWQPAFNGGNADGFVAKTGPNGGSILAASYMGTGNYDQVFFIEVDRLNQVYLLGQSRNGSFPVINSAYVDPGSSQFVTRLDEDLTTAINSTVFGSGNNALDISPAAFLVDICGNIYISGWGRDLFTGSSAAGMPITQDAFQPTSSNVDFYLLVIERDFSDTLYGTYIGGGSAGEHVDGGTSRFDANGVVYQSVCGGCGGFSDFTTSPGAWSDQNLSGNCNNLIFKFDFELIPDADFTVNNTIGCAPFTVDFTNFSTDSDSYLWDFGNGDTTSVIFEPTVTFDTAGVYEVFLYVTDSICLLTDTAQITITVTDSLELTTIPDQELCIPTDIDFIAYTNGSADTFIWSSNSNFTDTLNAGGTSDSVWTYQPTNPGVYYIEVSNDGCSLVDSVVVDYIGSALTLSANDSICAGESTTITATNSNPQITFTYEWSPDSVIVTPSTTNQVTVAPTVTQFIYVTASSNTGCVVEDSIQIFVGYIPPGSVIATATPNSVPAGGTTTLSGQPSGFSYEWTPGEGVVNVNSQVTQATVDQPTIYTLTVTDGICLRTDTTLVDVFTFICEDPFVYIPNAFSPNDDGENEVLYVRGAMVEKMVFRIYDRWGELVFESFDRADGWDGTFRGKPMDPDTYDYYLQVTCIGGLEEIIKGNVTLMR
ncbi:MAG: gliding motility-associated C-terminal domain-containing protein [bacterium]|nr:gliding motility-associated C-terminal domain-containing protein [bacterium]